MPRCPFSEPPSAAARSPNILWKNHSIRRSKWLLTRWFCKSALVSTALQPFASAVERSPALPFGTSALLRGSLKEPKTGDAQNPATYFRRPRVSHAQDMRARSLAPSKCSVRVSKEVWITSLDRASASSTLNISAAFTGPWRGEKWVSKSGNPLPTKNQKAKVWFLGFPSKTEINKGTLKMGCNTTTRNIRPCLRM